MRTNCESTMPWSFAITPFSTRSSKKAMSSGRSPSRDLKTYFKRASARSASAPRSAKAISGSIIQNSARWRLVFEFSARNVGPNVYTGQRETIRFDFKLPGHCQERFAAKEILGEIDFALGRARQVGEVERGDAKQRSGTFGIGS